MRIFLFIFFCFPSLSYSADLSFNSIRLNELARLGYTQILAIDYVADNYFNNDENTVSIYVKNQNKQFIKNELNVVINNAGYDVIERGRVVRITKRLREKEPDLIPFFYKPKYRDTTYLSDMLSNVFKIGAFTFKRAVQNQQVVNSKDNNLSPQNSASSQVSKPQDAFIFNGTKSEIELLKILLAQIDTPEYQVQIKAYLYEVGNSENKASSFQVAASILGGFLKADITGQILSNVLSFSVGNVNSAISALNEDSRFNVVSSPSIVVKNRQKGSFSVGADVPILGQVSYQNNGQAVQSVEYKPSGVILDLTPVFNENNIELTIHHQISNFIKTTNGVNNSPTLIKRELTTVVNSKFEDVILLGGLSETKDTKSNSGLPFLPDFLKSKSSDISKSDILLLLHVTKI
jgi:type II secretory pathway component GspD/PulD (secretin)